MIINATFRVAIINLVIMKKVATLFILITLIPIFVFSQTSDRLDYVSPFNEGFSSVKKGDQWAFINTKGDIVIDFRNDLVLSKINNENYPVFKSSRCLISIKKEGITYFGYIDTSGETIIKPQFLNAKNFNNNRAIVVKFYRDILGENNVLQKQVVRYESLEVLIDENGTKLHHLTKAKGLALSRNYISKPPKIKSKFLTEDLIAIPVEGRKWKIKKLDNINPTI